MTTSMDHIAPYAPLANVIGLIRRRREKGLPEVLNVDKLLQIGIPEGNISRALQALKFLTLIDEEGRQTNNFNRLANAKESEYPEVLADIIRSAYRDIFVIIGHSEGFIEVSDQELIDAFRAYHPDAQRNRMIILFKGLCQEAGLMGGGPPETRKRTRTVNPAKSSSTSYNGAKKDQPKSDNHQQTDFYPSPPALASQQISQFQVDTMTSTPESVILQGLLNQLPFLEKKWTQSRREKWIQAVTATVDLLFKTTDSESEDIYDV